MSAPPTAAPSPERATGTCALDLVLARVSGECADLAAAVDLLQETIGGLLDSGAVTGDVAAATIRSLQDADRLSQTLRSLSALLAQIAPATAGQCMDYDVLANAVRLDGVAHRLLRDGAAAENPPAGTGGLDTLF